jgi:hypothetical protein
MRLDSDVVEIEPERATQRWPASRAIARATRFADAELLETRLPAEYALGRDFALDAQLFPRSPARGFDFPELRTVKDASAVERDTLPNGERPGEMLELVREQNRLLKQILDNQRDAGRVVVSSAGYME